MAWETVGTFALEPEDDIHIEAAVIQSIAALSTDELYHQFIADVTEIVSSSRGEPWWDLMELADAALDIEDVEERIETLEYYVDLAERGLSIEGYDFCWNDGYIIYREV